MGIFAIIWSLILAFLPTSAFASVPAFPSESASIAILRTRIQNEVTDSIPESERPQWQVPEIKEWKTLAQSDGSFSDLDYLDEQSPRWGPLVNLDRALRLATAYRLKGNPFYHDAATGELSLRAIRFFASQKWWHYNWWTMEIATPLTTSKILALMGDDLDPKSRRVLLEATRMGDIVTHPSQWAVTGQNAIWYARISIALGVIEKRPSLIRAATKAIAKELTLGNAQGLQYDLSFFQHGPLLYSGGYGLSFAVDLPTLVRLLSGTRFALEPKNIELLGDYILDGELWLVQGSAFDLSTMGRYYARENGLDSKMLLPACAEMAKNPGPRQARYASCARRTGNRLFWLSDFMVHNRKGFGISVRMDSKRTQNADFTPNGEGLRSEYLADGMTSIYRTGAEYANLQPIFDFLKIPGATTELLPAYPAVENSNYTPHHGETEWVGGVSDGDTGLATMDFRRGKLTVKKAWFFFEGGMVALGAGIRSSGEYPVVTTVNQEWSKGNIQFHSDESRDAKTLESGEKKIDGLKWAYANGVGYLFLEKNSVTLKNDVQRGSWRLLGAQLSPDPVSGKVTSLWFNHSGNLDHYAYAVIPGVSETKIEAMADKSEFSVLENSEALQSVEFLKTPIIQSVFYAPGKIAWKKSRIAVDGPVALQLKRSPEGCTLSVNNPDQVPRTVKIEWSWCADENCETAPAQMKTVAFLDGKTTVREQTQTFSVSCR
jgi:chondroitin AC lyase